MATPVYNPLWPQGEDLVFTLIYEEGPEGSLVPVDITGYTVRMDLVNPQNDNAVVYTFNTAEQEDPDEVTIQPGAVTGLINIVVPRSLTLPGVPDNGAVYDLMEAETPVTVFNYDIFLRNTDDKQKKLLRGTVTIEPSYTLWA